MYRDIGEPYHYAVKGKNDARPQTALGYATPFIKKNARKV